MPIDNPYTAHIVANALLDARRNAARHAPRRADAWYPHGPRDVLGRLRRAFRRRR